MNDIYGSVVVRVTVNNVAGRSRAGSYVVIMRTHCFYGEREAVLEEWKQLNPKLAPLVFATFEAREDM